MLIGKSVTLGVQIHLTNLASHISMSLKWIPTKKRTFTESGMTN